MPATKGGDDAMRKGFLFDVFGTLVDWRSGVADRLGAEFDRRGIDADPTDVADHWRSLYAPSMERIRSGARNYVPLDLLHRENLDETLAEFGIGETFDADARADLGRAWEALPPWPDVHEGMRRLRPLGYLAPCSNGSVALSVRLARFAGLHWDAIAGAELARDYKPKPEVYLASVRALGLDPHEVVMVAAHNSDLAAARALGLGTAFVARPTEHGPAQTSDLSPEDDWDHVARDLGELAARIEARG
ncbi:haloacid dehalogenase type II [Palleronia sp. LCG004]|uniref:haloacid dehalogenase type II n=1 Tax=Palleronia sp. LCG004 TaxID=3079304 RepID=UPI002941C716|nr:haloacid dehalogenase type II [Palleronia sp. LCG004]WOI56818.1 haloacid dehalogenase type II [Palleronia sp. LCG004]